MFFAFTDEQRMAADVIGDVLRDTCSAATLRQGLADNRIYDATRSRKLSEAGMSGLLVPEEHGGLGLGEVDFLLIAEACGKACLPEPFVEQTGVAVPLLARFAEVPPVGDVLQRIIGGQTTLGLSHPINPYAAQADWPDMLLLSHEGEVHLIETSHVRLLPQAGIDPFRHLFRVEWTARADTRIATSEQGSAAWSQTLERGALFVAAQGLGLAQALVDLSVAYAKDRQQFGKPIGSYQAIKHRLADAQVKIEFARPVVAAAATAKGATGPLAQRRVSHARLAALAAADFAARAAVQVHGAMGYAWEVDVHFFLKRALALSGSYGSASFHRARVMNHLFSEKAALGAAATFAHDPSH